jgi:pyruvate dehydrogenase E2 component (dihydrolipoamide acetyltransferase)
VQIKIPDIGDVDSVEVIELCVSVGDTVSPDDALIVIESDKASMEVPATVGGVVESIAVALGDSVSTGDVIVTLVADATSAETEAAPAPEPEVVTSPEANVAPTLVAATPTATVGASMQLDIAVPDVGDADGVEVVEVSVAPGDSVANGDLLVILESDKASMEVPCEHTGTVVRVHVKVGDMVQQDSLLVTLEVAGDEVTGDMPSASTAAPTEPPATTLATTSKETGSNNKADVGTSAAAQEVARSEPAQAPVAGAPVYAGPAVRRLARELGVDLSQVKGSGSNGRLVKDDVKNFVKRQLNAPATAQSGQGGGIPQIPTVDFAKFGPITLEPMGRVRELGAQNLHRSWLNVVHVTQHDDANITELETFRGSLKAQGEAKGIKITPLAFIIKACCAALQEFPTFNASLDAQVQNFILKQYYNIGFAVDTPYGLVVPVLKEVDKKGIWDLSAEIIEMAGKARDRKLSMNDMQGGTFSVSSLGAIGGTGFTPIVNAPEVAILGVGRTTMKPHWTGSEFEPAKMLPLSLSYDHRAINGAEAGRFVQRLTQLLGDVRQLVL